MPDFKVGGAYVELYTKGGAEVKDELKNLEKEYKEYEKQYKKITDEIAKTHKKLTESYTTQTMEDTQLKQLKKDLDELTTKQSEARKQEGSQIKELELRIKELRLSKREAASEEISQIQKLERELLELQKKKEENAKKDLADTKKIQDAIKELNDKKDNTGGLSKETIKLQEKMKELNSSKDELKTKLSELSDKIIELKTLSGQLPTYVNDAFKNTGDGAEQIDTNLEKMNKKINESIDKLQAYAEQIKKNEQEKKKLKTQIADATKTYGKNSQEVKRLNKEYKELNVKQEVTKKLFKQTNDALDKQINKFAQSEKQADKFSKSFDNVGKKLTLVKAVLTSLFAKKLYSWLIDMNSEIEQYIVSFTTLLGDIRNAESIMNEIVHIARVTPFETTDVVKAVEILAQYGEAQEELIPMFNKLANLSRGNVENLESISEAYARIKNAGKVTLRELNIMIRRSVPIMQALADVTGHTVGELYALIRAGKLGVEELDAAINYLTTNGGKFEGLVEQQGKTLEGRISTLKDYIAFIGKDIGEETFAQLKGYIEEVIIELDRLEKSGDLKNFTKEIGSDIAIIVEVTSKILKFLYEYKDILGIATGALLSFGAATKYTSNLLKNFNIEASTKSIIKLNGALLLVTATLAVTTAALTDIKKKEQELIGDSQSLIKESKAIRNAYKNEAKAISENAEEAIRLKNELESLINVEDKNVAQKEKILDIVSRLNELYPNLNIQYSAERDELNKNVQALDDYITKFKEYANTKANEEVYLELKKKKAQLDADYAIKNEEFMTHLAVDEIIDEEFEKIKNNVLDYGVSDLIIKGIANRNNEAILFTLHDGLEEIDKERKEVEKQIDIILKNIENAQNKITEEPTIKTIPTFDGISNAIANANKELEHAQSAIGDTSSTYYKEVEETIEVVDDLTNAMSKNASNVSFSSDEILNILNKYPSLKESIYETADGYKIEEQALRELTKARIEDAKVAISSQLEIANAQVKEIDTQLANYKGTREDFDELIGLRVELVENIKEYEKALEVYNKQLDIAASLKGRKEEGKEEDLAADIIRNLKYEYDIGKITAKKYYDELEKIKDNYYTDGSQKWQQYTLEVKKGREKIEEELKKAAEEEFKGTIDDMRQVMEDEEFYDRLSKEQKIESLKEIRQYILDSYEQRRIDYENFAEELRQVDKDIYAEEKELLEQNIDEIKELRDKKYDEAVKQIEDYYDAIFAAQRAAEREQEMQELKETAALYEGAVSRAGQQKLKELQKDIQELEKEKIQDELENQREYHLENLDAKYKALEESQNSYFDTIQGGIKTTAQIVEEYTKQINDFFSQINTVLSTVRSTNGSNTQNLTINQNIYDAASNRAAIDMTKVVSNYGFK